MVSNSPLLENGFKNDGNLDSGQTRTLRLQTTSLPTPLICLFVRLLVLSAITAPYPIIVQTGMIGLLLEAYFAAEECSMRFGYRWKLLIAALISNTLTSDDISNPRLVGQRPSVSMRSLETTYDEPKVHYSDKL